MNEPTSDAKPPPLMLAELDLTSPKASTNRESILASSAEITSLCSYYIRSGVHRSAPT